MFDINWNRFALLHADCTRAFEDLCYHLFCRKYNQKEGIRTDFNQVGLETEPIENNGKYYGFQSKYFKKNISYDNIKDSIKKALDNYRDLDHIIIYLNQQAKPSSISAKNIVKLCKKYGVTVEWFLPNNFKIALNQPSNLDLAEMYFGEVEIIKKLSDSKSIRIDTLIQSQEYVKLTLSNHDDVCDIEQFTHNALALPDKLFLISGTAGSGKSVLMRHIQNTLGGYSKHSLEEQKEAVEKVGALCIFIHLNKGHIRELVNAETKDIKNQNFIFLLDGLDEIPESNLTTSLQFIEELTEKDATKKIIISSRLYSYNKTALKSLYPSISEFIINDLSIEQIEGYFKDKKDEAKEKRLHELIERNNILYEKISDILTLVMLWDYIYDIADYSALSDLMSLNIKALLYDVNHKKQLELLNLPSPISEAIISINKAISLYLFENDRYSFRKNEVESIIIDMFPRCDYQSVNRIINYLVDAFFDYNTSSNSTVYSYRHRRYAEYFTMLCIEEKMKDGLGYLREHNIIIDYDLFDSMLMPYLHRKAIKEKDISLALQGGLFNVYLGKDNAWGVDNDLYFWSTWIVYAIAALPKDILINAVENKGLPIYRFFHETPKRIIETLSKEKSSRMNPLSRDYLMITLLVSLLCKYNKLQWFPHLKEDYSLIRKLASGNRYYFRTISNKDGFLFWHSQLYIDLISGFQNTDKMIDIVLGRPIQLPELSELDRNIPSKIYFTSALFYNLILYNQQKCAEVIGRLSIDQLSVFAFACSRPECLSVILTEGLVKEALATALKSEIDNDTFESVVCIALKRVIGIDLTKNEFTYLNNYLHTKKISSYSIVYKELSDFVSFLICTCEDYTDFIDEELRKYASAYINLYKLIRKGITDQEFFRRALLAMSMQSESSYYILVLIGKALAMVSMECSAAANAIEYISDRLNKEKLLIIFHVIKQINPERFNQIVSISAISSMMDYSYSDVSFESSGDQLFMLSFISSDQDGLYSYRTLLNGISKSYMRMNDRNDTLCDYQIVESLEVILRNHWASLDAIKGYLDRILGFAMIMNRYHIENDLYGKLLDLLLQYDFKAAEYYYNQICDLITDYNQLHYQFALASIQRGRNIDGIRNCIKKINCIFDRMEQRIELDYYYKRIELFLKVADTDYYSKAIKDEYYSNACKEIDYMENAGWERSLTQELHEVYVRQCLARGKEADVELKEYRPYPIVKGEKINSFEALTAVNDREGFFDFIDKTKSVAALDSFEINNLLIDKSLVLCGDISKIIEQIKKCYYPNNTYYCANSEYFWMTVVCALKNPKSKTEMMTYLLEGGGGHDGFCELIKINGALGNKNTTIELFERLLDCVDFLLT